VLLAFHVDSKIKSILVRHRLSKKVEKPGIFEKLENPPQTQF
jgi:hypothetical protein